MARQGGGGDEPRCGGTESYRGALQEQRASLVGVGHVGDENVVVVPDGGEGVDKIRGEQRGAWGWDWGRGGGSVAPWAYTMQRQERTPANEAHHRSVPTLSRKAPER